MKRRNFIGTSGLFAMSSIVNGSSLKMKEQLQEKQHSNSKGMKITSIAGYKPQELLEKYRQFLFDDFLPFMDKYIIDHELGGFMCNTDRSGKNITTNKRAWYDGRGIWVYSFLYNNLKKDPAYLETAKKTVDFVLRIKPDDKKLWPASYTRDGKGLTDIPIDIYGDLFIAEGLAEFSKASGDTKYWDIAKEILINCLNLYDSDDFNFIVDYGPKAPVVPAPRVVGSWMVFIRTSYCLLNHKPDTEIEKIINRCIDALMNHHYNSEFGLINEVMNHDLTRSEGPFSQFVYTGHDIETMWMVMFDAIRRKDSKLFEDAIEKFKRHVEVAWDDVYGGVFRCLENVNNNIWQVDKVLWEQAEVLIGTLLLIEHTGDPWAFQWFEKTFKYVMENYPLKKYGYSLWNIGGDRKMTFIKEGIRIENYHHPRHLMLNILSLERIINAGGKVEPV
jgi:mannose/cellobiose epimerase-like protein (N-acyl-D-glucosamine 2-epimerase family)